MAAPETEFGTRLERWLDRLDRVADDGRPVGIRERLAVHDLLAGLRASGELPPTERERLALLAPLVCTSPGSQERYEAVLEDFLKERPDFRDTPTRDLGTVGKPTQDSRPFPWEWLVAAVAGMAIVLALVFLTRPPADPTVPKPDIPPGPPTNYPGTPIEPNYWFTYYTNQILIPEIPFTPGHRPVRFVSGVLATLCGIALAAWAWALWRRRQYLNQARTDREVEERVLRDPSVAGDLFPGESVRVVSRGLRQRVFGHREVLHLRETVRATVRAGGALAPRFRRLQTTPEYVVLVDRRHARDHFAHAVSRLIAALHEQGVALEAYSFEESPEFGCRRWTSSRSPETAGPRLTAAEVGHRAAGCRLLVFSEMAAAQDPLTGRAREWLSAFRATGEKAWFTPMPMPSWGRAESLADQLGFLVLPAQLESLDALVGWLASDQPVLRPGADWPAAFPELLREDGVSWVARQAPPPDRVLETLLFELRRYLGPVRFQWLCVCAIFPAVAPTLTRALGAELIQEPDLRKRTRDQTLGLLALGALPFFRYGHLPQWLRRALVARLDSGNQGRFRSLIEERLGKSVFTGGEELVRIGRIRRLWAWLGRGTGLARDVVLVEFLRPGHLSPLVQRLPEALRRRLFRHGMAAHGVRAWVVVSLALLTVAALAFPKIWGRVAPPQVIAARNVLTNAVTFQAFTNSLGMVFVPITIGDASYEAKGAQAQMVQQSAAPPASTASVVWFSVWETRVRDYEAYAGANPSVDGLWRNPTYQEIPLTPGPEHPVVEVIWEDANGFCEWLTDRELKAGVLKPGQQYRLPRDEEWSRAVGLEAEVGATPKERDMKVEDVYPWGRQWPPPDYVGNYADEAGKARFGSDWLTIPGYRDGQAVTSAVGTYPALTNGLYDLGGNVLEWCEDYYDGKAGARVVRGGSWDDVDPRNLLSSYRYGLDPGDRGNRIGFRVVLVGDGSAR